MVKKITISMWCKMNKHKNYITHSLLPYPTSSSFYYFTVSKLSTIFFYFIPRIHWNWFFHMKNGKILQLQCYFLLLKHPTTLHATIPFVIYALLHHLCDFSSLHLCNENFVVLGCAYSVIFSFFINIIFFPSPPFRVFPCF